MGPGETFSLIAVVVLLMMALGIVGTIYNRRLAHKERMAQLQSGAAGSAEDRARIERLEQRVRVLERIATDRKALAGEALAAEIEDLRRTPAPTGELQ